MKAGTRLVWTMVAIGVIGATIAAGHAQQIRGGWFGRTPPKFPTATTFAGHFNFCRLMFMSDRREKQGWGTDHPGADLNFSVRLSELTKVNMKMNHEGSEDETPDAVVVRLTDEALFQCPFTMIEDAGTARFSAAEIERLLGVSAEGWLSPRHGLSRHLCAGAV